MPPGEVAGRRPCLVGVGCRHAAGFRAERWSPFQRLHDPELPVLEVRLDVRVVQSGDEGRAGQDPGHDQEERTGDAVVVLIIQPRHVHPRGGAPLEHENTDRAGQDRNRESRLRDRRTRQRRRREGQSEPDDQQEIERAQDPVAPLAKPIRPEPRAAGRHGDDDGDGPQDGVPAEEQEADHRPLEHQTAQRPPVEERDDRPAVGLRVLHVREVRADPGTRCGPSRPRRSPRAIAAGGCGRFRGTGPRRCCAGHRSGTPPGRSCR